MAGSVSHPADGDPRRDSSDGIQETAQSYALRGRAIPFTVDPARVLRVLLVVIGGLVVLSTVTRMVVLYLPDFPARDATAKFFYVDFERSLPTLYSTGVLVLSAVLCGVIAGAQRRLGASDVRQWIVLSAIFGVIALDEFGQLHERLIKPLRDLFDIEGGPFWFAWVVPAILALAVFVIFFIQFFRRLPRSTRRGMLTAGVLFVGGALGVEILGGSYAAGHPAVDVTYVAFVTLEETLEMLGIAVLIWSLLVFIAVGLPDTCWTVRVTPSGRSQRSPDGGDGELRAGRVSAG